MRHFKEMMLISALLSAVSAIGAPTPVARALLDKTVSGLFSGSRDFAPSSVELSFLRPLTDLECRHVRARLDEARETIEMFRASGLHDSSSLLALSRKSLAEWNDFWQQPVLRFSASYHYPDHMSQESMQDAFKLFTGSGFSEIAFRDFLLLKLKSFEIRWEEHSFSVHGQMTPLDVCVLGGVDLWVVPQCRIEDSSQLSRCVNFESLRFHFLPQAAVRDSELEVRRK